MVRRVILIILIAVLALLLFNVGDDIEANEEYTIYIPMLQYNEQQCDFPVDQGAAWMYTNQMPEWLRKRFCIQDGYYHSASWRDRYWKDGGMPMVRVDWEWDVDSTFIDKLEYLEENQYSGIWFLMNEPHWQERITHCQAAEAVYIAQQYNIPGQMIWWNGIWLDDLTETLTCYRMMYNNTIPKGIIGLHGYNIANEYGWGADSIPNFLSEACNIVWSHGYRTCKFSLSEIAVPNAHLGEVAYQAQWNWLTGIEAVANGEHAPIEIVSVYYFTHCPDCAAWSGNDWDTTFNSRFWTEFDTDFGYYEPTYSGQALLDYEAYP